MPGSGKSSLIHALAGQLALDIYVVSLSASWISDNTLTTLMGRVPARCVLLLEDLDAAFTRSVGSRVGGFGGGDEYDEFGEDDSFGYGSGGGSGGGGGGGSGFSSSGGLDMSAFPGISPGSGLAGFGNGGVSSSRTSAFSGGLGWRKLGSGGGSGMYSGRNGGLSDMNTLSLSGLLNALDGVAASEGRLLFAYVVGPLRIY